MYLEAFLMNENRVVSGFSMLLISWMLVSCGFNKPSGSYIHYLLSSFLSLFLFSIRNILCTDIVEILGRNSHGNMWNIISNNEPSLQVPERQYQYFHETIGDATIKEASTSCWARTVCFATSVYVWSDLATFFFFLIWYFLSGFLE